MKAVGRWSRLWAALGGRAKATAEASEPAGASDVEAPAARAPAVATRHQPSEPSREGEGELDAIRQVDGQSPTSRARALEALSRAAGTPLEHRALAACLTAHGRHRAPSDLLCLAAELFTRRGDADAALRLLEGLDDPRGWLLEADLRAERGQHAFALALVERTLAYSIDAPGALERARRWRPQKSVAPGANEPTLLAAQTPHPSLEIVREAGRGGAATVYEANDTALGRSVALKVYHRPERSREQLLREATLAVRFSGAGVVRVFDVAADAGWLAMEWAAGRSLRQCLVQAPRETPPLDTTLWTLALTLARIHAAGYVHADVKPGNLLFRADQVVLLSDFGLSVPSGELHLGQSVGYAPPERLAGGRATAADDVYALGRVVNEMLDAGVPAADPARWRVLAESLTSSERPKDASGVLELLPEPPGNR